MQNIARPQINLINGSVFFTRWRLASLAVILIAAAVYARSLTGMKIWNDDLLVSGQGIGGGQSLLHCFTVPYLHLYFQPLTSLSFFVEGKFWDDDSIILYHQTNLLLHVLTTVALLGLLRAAFGNRRIALLGSLLFALLPAQVGAVAWIGGRTDSLAALWVVIFGWALIAAVRQAGRRRALLLATSTAAYFAALLTKEQAIFLLPLAPLAFRCFTPKTGNQALGIRRSGLQVFRSSGIQDYAGVQAFSVRSDISIENRKSDSYFILHPSSFILCLPFVIAAITFVALWFTLSPHHAPAEPYRLGETAGIIGRSITYYALLLLLPTPQWMHTFSLGALDHAGLWPALCGYVLLILVAALFRRWLRTAPQAAWFLAMASLALLPVCNFVPEPSLMVAPYRACLAGIGIAALLGWIIMGDRDQGSGVREEREGKRQEGREGEQSKIQNLQPPIPNPHSLLRWAAAALYAAWCLGLTVWGVQQWQDPVQIESTIVHYDPDCLYACYNLTSELYKQHRYRQTIAQVETALDRAFGSSMWRNRAAALAALRADPSILSRIRTSQGYGIPPQDWLALFYGRLGFARLNSSDLTEAKQAFQIGAVLSPRSPDVNMGLGICAFDSSDKRMAESYLQKTIAYDPNQPEAHLLLGRIYSGCRQWKQACVEYQSCIRLAPWTGKAYVEMAKAQIKLGDPAGAEATLQKGSHLSFLDLNSVRAYLASLEKSNSI